MKQTQFTVWVNGGSLPIVFPAITAKTQGTNGQVVVPAGTDVIALPANAARKFAQVINTSGTPGNIAFGAAASAVTAPVPNNGVWTLDIATNISINQQAVHFYNPSGAPITISVYEE